VEGRAPTSAAVRQGLLGSQIEQNKRAGSCFLVEVGLFVCAYSFKERNELFGGHKCFDYLMLPEEGGL